VIILVSKELIGKNLQNRQLRFILPNNHWQQHNMVILQLGKCKSVNAVRY